MARAHERLALGRLLERAREDRGLTQGAVAEVMGISQQAVSNWEHGYARPKPSALPALADLLGLDPMVLLVEAGYLSQASPSQALVVGQDVGGDERCPIVARATGEGLTRRVGSPPDREARIDALVARVEALAPKLEELLDVLLGQERAPPSAEPTA